jgi:hypothetical protein
MADLRPPSRLRSLLFALLPTLLLLASLEGLVALFLPRSAGVDLSRGFGDEVRYLLPTADGGFRTTMFTREVDEKVAAPKGQALRVLLFGGSNTEGFPHDYLQDRLAEAASQVGRTVQVVNLGRRGYGSTRVRALFDQALEQDPDLLVVYSGHNEFVEASFRLDLERGAGGAGRGLVAALDRGARRLGSYRVLQGFFAERAGRAQAVRRPQEYQFEHEKFADLTPAQSAEKFALYRENLTHLARRAREAGVPLVLCTVVGNDLAAPFVSTPGEEVTAEQRARLDTELAAARAAQSEALSFLVPPTAADRLHFEDWLRKDGTELAPADIPQAAEYRSPFDRAHRWWSPPTTWSPRVEPFLRRLFALRSGALAAADLAAAEASLAPLGRVLELVPDHPEALFRLGLAELALGRRELGAEHLRAGGAADRAPRRGTAHSNGIVREVAAAESGVVLCDLEASIRARAPDGLVGFELMQDECHLHQAPRYVLIHDLAECLVSELFPDLDELGRQRTQQAWALSFERLLSQAPAHERRPR